MNRQTYHDTFIRVVAHFMLTDPDGLSTYNLQYDDGDLDVMMVKAEKVAAFFPDDKHRKAALGSLAGLSANEDDDSAVAHPGGPLWMGERHEHTWEEGDTGRMFIEDIGFTPQGLSRLVVDGVIPAEFIGAISHDKKIIKKIRSSYAFKKWLAGSWVDPTKAGPFRRLDLKTDTYSARTAIQTTAFVKQLSYTPEEAQKAYEFIEAANLRDRSKAAYKAHVSRRIAA